MYLGCLGIKEIVQNKHTLNKEELLQFSIKYAMLLYLKEELTYLKSFNSQYLSRLDDIYHSFIFKVTKILSLALNRFVTVDGVLKQIQTFIENDNDVNKYSNFSASLCSDLFKIIDTTDLRSKLEKHTNDKASETINNKKCEMKEFLKSLHLEVEFHCKNNGNKNKIEKDVLI